MEYVHVKKEASLLTLTAGSGSGPQTSAAVLKHRRPGTGEGGVVNFRL